VFSSYYGDKRYDFRITPEQLAKTPAWLQDQPNPPLSARRALAIFRQLSWAAGYASRASRNRSSVTMSTAPTWKGWLTAPAVGNETFPFMGTDTG